ncbi:unnamed protein product [Caenorhabditis angaria]|uniref:Uncharacterized protein n=1 Tax=Caenorhabditis angaria TaxID=860376 RepID=A0A9P1IEY6_9PELO|nr:unnamed protein product [Caenorhabditis angaria]
MNRCITFSLDGSSYICDKHLCKTDDIDKSMDFLMDIFDKRTSDKLKGIKLPENLITCLEVEFEELSMSIDLKDRQDVQIYLSAF